MWNLDRRVNLMEKLYCIDSPEYISDKIITPTEMKCFHLNKCKSNEYTFKFRI